MHIYLSLYVCWVHLCADFFFFFFFAEDLITLVLLNPDIPTFANSVDPDQLASEEANWSGSALFAIKYVNS